MGNENDSDRATQTKKKGTASRQTPGFKSKFSADNIEAVRLDRLAELEGQRVDRQSELRELRQSKQPGRQSNAQPRDLGNFAHEYAEELIPKSKLPRGLNKEVVVELTDGPSQRVKRLDRVDFENGVIYELKPDTPAEMAKGRQQLKNYAIIMDREQPFRDRRRRVRPWKTKLLTYNKRALARIARRVGAISNLSYESLPESWREPPSVRRDAGKRPDRWPRISARATTESVKRAQKAATKAKARQGRARPKGRGASLPSIAFDVSGASEIVYGLLDGLVDYLKGTGPDVIPDQVAKLYPKVEKVWQAEMERNATVALHRAQKGPVFAEVELKIGVYTDSDGDSQLAFLWPTFRRFSNDELSGSCYEGRNFPKAADQKKLKKLGLMRDLGGFSYGNPSVGGSKTMVRCTSALPVNLAQLAKPLTSVNLSGRWLEFQGHGDAERPVASEARSKLVSIFRMADSAEALDITGRRVFLGGASGNIIENGPAYAVTDVVWAEDRRRLSFTYKQGTGLTGFATIFLIDRDLLTGQVRLVHHEYSASETHKVMLQRQRDRRDYR